MPSPILRQLRKISLRQLCQRYPFRSQTVHARHSYLPAEVLFGQRFADIFSTDPDGARVIDYNRFHETGPA